ncbi:DNA repair protein RecO [Pseudotenacibaculum sp. MALMAid0570]|uniref:DNA repair protein RecO n=1 Tax=Pseudotenacibaculum sp. MALMAid0570 TaxID=3143938 RepID=UPI0032E02CAB
MAIVSTKAIVISTIKYGDSSLIARLYTNEFGLVSYLIKGILKSKKGKLKAAYFQPLTQLNIVASHQEKRGLQSIREAQVINMYKTLHLNIVKQSVVLFLAEMMSGAIQEEEENQPLYNYLEKAFLWLDNHDNISNFHLLFLLNLTKFLGFYPDTSEIHKTGFHLREGTFTDFEHEKEVVKGEEILQFKKLLGINFDTIESINFSKKQRQDLLRMLIQYFELHLGGFKHPKSLHVLEAVFSR